MKKTYKMRDAEAVRTIEMDKPYMEIKCIKCEKDFKSYGIQNRMCQNCKSNKIETTDWMIGQ